MHIDWLTLLAQMLNFLILVALLKRFLYRPVLAAIEQREAYIARRLQEATEKDALAHQQETYYRNVLQELRNSEAGLLLQARQEAEQQRRHLLEQARQEVEHLAERWRTTLQHEQQALLQSLRQQAGEKVCAIARRVLADLAEVDLQRCIIAVFVTRLTALDAAGRQALASAARTHPQGVCIRTAFPLAAADQQRLRQAVTTQLAAAIPVHFEDAPHLLCGIELEVPGQQKVAWTLDSYLEQFAEHFAAQLTATAR